VARDTQEGSATQPLPQVAVNTACRLPLRLHLLGWALDIPPLWYSRRSLLQAPHDFCRAFAVHGDTDQGAIAGVYIPVPYLSVLCNMHGVYPILAWPGWAGQGVPSSPLLSLLPLAPAVRYPMGPPRAAVFVVQLHLYAMLATPAFGWYLLAFGLLLCGEAL